MINYLTEDKRVWEIENFLSEEELSRFDDHIKKTEWVTQEKWENVTYKNNTSIFPDVKFIIDRTADATDHKYLWSSMGIIMRIQPSMYLSPHVDNYNNPDSDLTKNWLSAHIYLNDNFDGGELYYANLNINYKPKRGSIVFHPGFEDIYMHGVKKVVGSDRYAIGLVGKSLTSKIYLV
jgi:hypothetical protein